MRTALDWRLYTSGTHVGHIPLPWCGRLAVIGMRHTGAALEIYLSDPVTESAGACSYQLMDDGIWGLSVPGASPWALSLVAVDLPPMAHLCVRCHPSLFAAVTVRPSVCPCRRETVTLASVLPSFDRRARWALPDK